MSGNPHQRPSHRKSNFSCEACRRRKVKCNGGRPTCMPCQARDEDCRYNLTPTLSYTQALEARLQELESLHADKSLQSTLTHESRASSSMSPSVSLSLDPSDKNNLKHSERFEGLTLDDDGRISFHSATSLFHTPHTPGKDDRPEAQPDSAGPLAEAKRARLTSNAWRQRAFEHLADIPEPFKYLLDSHWCWVQPLFNFVYRPAFTRDMETLGPYYSHTLLNAILSQSVRWCRSDPNVSHLLASYDSGNIFFRQAIATLHEELITGHGRIATVQTLLLVSARECSQGNRTQAWLFSGMAFRLIEDMGICVDGQKYAGSAQFSEEDIEIRNRLFWSCYFWDKMISLYLGRTPVIQGSQVSPPQTILDDSSENDIWRPHGVTTIDNRAYPTTKAYSISCFIQTCKLSEILNTILLNLYNPTQRPAEEEINDCIRTQGLALQRWHDELPEFLRVEHLNLPLISPPSHIVIMNCLYHTFSILLYRPIFFIRDGHAQSREYLVKCCESAVAIISTYDVYRSSFGDSHCVMSLSYSLYTAASIFLLEMQRMDFDTGKAHVYYCIEAMESVESFNPVIKYPLKLVRQQVQKLSAEYSQGILDHLAQEHSPFGINASNIYPTELDSLVWADADLYTPREDFLLPAVPFDGDLVIHEVQMN